MGEETRLKYRYLDLRRDRPAEALRLRSRANQAARRVLDAIDSPALQIILDTVNLLTPDNHARCNELIDESVRLFGARIRVLHMKDYRIVPGMTDVQSIACGTGCMDYTRLLAFARSRPGLPMTLEDTVPSNAEAARMFLENV